VTDQSLAGHPGTNPANFLEPRSGPYEYATKRGLSRHGSNRNAISTDNAFQGLLQSRVVAYAIWFIRTARQFLGTMFLLFLQHYGGAVVVESGLGDLAACVPFELDGHAALIFHVKGRPSPRK
jgi:hypothetical protein